MPSFFKKNVLKINGLELPSVNIKNIGISDTMKNTSYNDIALSEGYIDFKIDKEIVDKAQKELNASNAKEIKHLRKTIAEASLMLQSMQKKIKEKDDMLAKALSSASQLQIENERLKKELDETHSRWEILDI